jgi:Zn-dependent oligopeptidase
LATPFTPIGAGYYHGLSGTMVHWDFVELPSQIMKTGFWQKKP